jgi:hypothetical protein
MAFTDAQIERLRARLSAYREHEGRNGRARPWKSVLDDILMAETTRHEYPEDGSLPEFREEALRRFAAGTSVLTEDKLEDIRAFLIEKRYLTSCELEEGEWSFASALALSALFSGSGADNALLSCLAGSYAAECPARSGGQKGTTRYELTVERMEGEQALALRQEWFTWAYDQPFTEELRRRYAQQIRSRTGFGVGGGNSGMMLFFKDGYTGKAEIATVTAVDAGARSAGRASWFRSVALTPELRELSERPADAEPLPQTALTYEQSGEAAEAARPALRARA